MARPAVTSTDAITRTALRLFVERGYGAVTVADIAGELGISRPTFFRHVAGKEEIVLGVLERLMVELAADLQTRPGSPWAALTGAVCDRLEAMDPTDPSDPAALASYLVWTTPELSKALVDARWVAHLTEALLARGSYGTDRDRCEQAAAFALALAQLAGSRRGKGRAWLREAFEGARTIVGP